MAILISILFFVLLTAAITVFGYRRYLRPARVMEQLSGPGAFAMPSVDRGKPDEPGLLVRVIQKVGEELPVNPEDVGLIRRDLVAAGYRDPSAVYLYLGARVLFCIALALLALYFRSDITSNPILRIVIPVGAALLGYFIPSFYLDHLVSRRQEKIRLSLPDALDLMVVSVEAGLGLDQAIQHVARELMSAHPELCEELELVNLEIRAGKRRLDALRNLAERNGETELRKLVAMMVQTDRFGTSIADSLRTHSDFMRVRRRQEAEERAGKVGVKLVFPIFFLMLPAMLVVAAGPGLLQVFKYLFPLMRQASQRGL
jgi:tight adherence protein C